MSPRPASLLLALVLLAAGAAPATSDQNDPRLDPLFEALAEGVGRAEAQRLETSIWLIWNEHADPAVGILMRLGNHQLAAGQLEAALEVFDQVVAREPDFAEGWNKRATTLFLQGRLADSLSDVARTLELEPRHFGALSGAGQIHWLQGDLEAAIEAYEAALAIHSHLPGTRRWLERLRRERPRI